MKLPHALQIYFTVSVKKGTVCRCIFQGNAAGEEAHSITCLLADNFCLSAMKELLKSDNVCERK